MGLNRPGALDRITLPSGTGRRGGTYAPDLSGGDANPYGAALQGLADGKTWGDVRLVSNRLHGTTISAAPPYDDSICLFPGVNGDDVTVTATIYRTGTPLVTQEVELLLCGSIGPYHAALYELQINTGTNHYANIVRWNGGGGTDVAMFTEFGLVTGIVGVNNGDVLKATKVGAVLSLYLNDNLLTSQNVSAAGPNLYGPATYRNGLVGVGYFQRLGTLANLLDFGLSNVQITAP